jgi:hypothetical protein
MANDGKYLNLTNGVPTQESAINASAGAGDAGKMTKLDGAGRFDASMMPVGTDIEATAITASEALAAGAFVNLWNSAGLKMRNADATVAGKEAHGFVLAAVANGAVGTAYTQGINTGCTGRTVGARQFLSTVAGSPVEAAPAATGNVAQPIGVALSATAVKFNPQTPVLAA